MTHPILTSPRLVLRQPTFSDAERMTALLQDPIIAQNTLTIPHPYTLEDAQAFFKRVNDAEYTKTDYVFAITLAGSNEMIGMVGCHPRSHGRFEVGYWLGADYRGQGYATEATRRIIAFGFEQLGANRMEALYFAHNPASRRVQEKAGMSFEGMLRGYEYKNGVYIDVGLCAIIRTDWENGA